MTSAVALRSSDKMQRKSFGEPTVAANSEAGVSREALPHAKHAGDNINANANLSPLALLS